LQTFPRHKNLQVFINFLKLPHKNSHPDHDLGNTAIINFQFLKQTRFFSEQVRALTEFFHHWSISHRNLFHINFFIKISVRFAFRCVAVCVAFSMQKFILIFIVSLCRTKVAKCDEILPILFWHSAGE
jgi:hypothetical protein